MAARRPCRGGSHGTRCTMRPVGIPNMPLILDLALHNGVAPVTGKRMGVETGDPRTFKSFEELWQAYEKQLELLISRLSVLCHVAHRVECERIRFPLWSCLDAGAWTMDGLLGRRHVQIQPLVLERQGTCGCRRLPHGGQDPGLRPEEAHHGRTNGGPGLQLRRRERRGNQADVSGGPQVRQRHPRGGHWCASPARWE